MTTARHLNEQQARRDQHAAEAVLAVETPPTDPDDKDEDDEAKPRSRRKTVPTLTDVVPS